jgi:DNA-binding winged helix-turn-helix (wHTH) protein
MLEPASGTAWAFEGFKVLPDMRLLLSDGTPVPLPSKAFDTLVLLIANRDRVVTKDELLRSVWPDVVVEEGNLTQQIFLLRKALGESAQQPRHIVTVRVTDTGLRHVSRRSQTTLPRQRFRQAPRLRRRPPRAAVRGSSVEASSCSAWSPF